MSEGDEKRGGKKWIIVAGLGLAAIAGAILAIRAHSSSSSTEKEANERQQKISKGPRVPVAIAKLSSGTRKISLQAEARPFTTSTLYAKAMGYLSIVRVDKGDQVSEREMLAVISTPEVDRQYQAAKADADNKWRIYQRSHILVQQHLIAQQDADQALAASRIADQALKPLAATRSYEIISAPFSGQVTQRFLDPGALVQASGSPIVTVAQTDRLRVWAYVDQRDAPFVHRGTPAHLTLPDRKSMRIDGVVARTTGELDRRSRTMLSEIHVDNAKGEIVPYSYVEITLDIETDRLVELPSAVLLFPKKQSTVAVVTKENKLAFRAVEIADDDGINVRLLSGIELGERAALNVGDLPEGQVVDPISIEPQPQPRS